MTESSGMSTKTPIRDRHAPVVPPTEGGARRPLAKRLLIPVRRVAWKVIDQLVSPRQRAMQRLYGELADIKSALAGLERQTSMNGCLPAPAGGAAQRPARSAPQSSWNSLAFAAQFRGPPDEIKNRQRDYVAYFRGRQAVLDIGCGRGEFLELMREEGVPAVGVELDPISVHLCQDKELDVRQIDALEYLTDVPDGSLGGVFSAQSVEHMEPAYLVELLNAARRKLEPGGVMVAETINPGSLYAMNNAFYLDPTHIRPVHPETLRFIMDQAGFEPLEVMFRAPVDKSLLPEAVGPPKGASSGEREAFEALSRNIQTLSDLLYGYQDYAVVGWRPDVDTTP